MKEKEERMKSEQVFNLTKKVTLLKLEKYKDLIHQKRNEEYYELYKSLNNLMEDSLNYTDLSFKELINNHTIKLKLWTSRIKNEDLKVTLEDFNRESYELLNLNTNLYTILCTKYNYNYDKSFFENCYFY